jgi:hypothetical protein
MRRSLPTDTPLVLYERAIDEIDPAAWDRFALACGGSFLSAWRVIRAEGLIASLRVFELYASGPAPGLKIGQCALAVTHDRTRFLDRLHLLPTHDGLWAASLQRIFERCGAGRYTYGSRWNAERRCLDALSGVLPSARIGDASTGIDTVDFAAFPTFAAYRRAISENIRRDYKKAAAAAPTVVIRRGASACRDIVDLVDLRREVMRRNQEPFSRLIDAPLHALKLLCMGDGAFIATVRAGGRAEAAFFGVQFGERVAYVSGGTRDHCEGFGSYLFLYLIERWFAQHPRGKLDLGITEPGLVPATYSRGNLLYRRKLRAASIPNTAFTLDVR